MYFKDICGYFPCAPFPRLETGKVVWVLSFDFSRIRINIAFRYSCHIGIPTFYSQIKVIESVSKICIDLLSELSILVPKTDKCTSDEIKRHTQLSWLQIQKGPSLYYFNDYLKRRTA